jgi:DNA polymerase III epsilon subunit-like protein
VAALLALSQARTQKALIFDLETTGLIPRDKNDISKFPYITQITILIYDLDLDKIIKTYTNYVKLPAGVEISKVVENITGITTQKCNETGVHIDDVLKMFYDEYQNVDYIVAHNLEFDIAVLNAQFVRAGIAPPGASGCCAPAAAAAARPKQFCTMLHGKKYLEIKYKNSSAGAASPLKRRSGLKYPKLIELFYDLFPNYSEEIIWHDSAADSRACLQCFLALRNFEMTNARA